MPLRTLPINEADLTFQDEGEGPPVILLHGFLGDWRTWRRQVEALSGRFRVLSLSQRYYYPNRWPDDGAGFGPAVHARDVAALIRALAIAPAHLVGHSYGGGVATLVALNDPSLVRTLILAEPALASVAASEPQMPALMAEFAQSRQLAYEQWQKGEKARAVEEHLRYVFGAEALERVRAEHYAVMEQNGPVIAAGYRPRPAPPPITAEQIASLRMPTLLIDGSASRPHFRVTCDKLATCFPNVERVTLQGASHALAMELPGAFNEAVLRFLDGK
jgi:pimeloyl-ACP methyl ester carboxylesterase